MNIHIWTLWTLYTLMNNIYYCYTVPFILWNYYYSLHTKIYVMAAGNNKKSKRHHALYGTVCTTYLSQEEEGQQ